MGNLLFACQRIPLSHRLDLDRNDALFQSGETIDGTMSSPTNDDVAIVLVGTIHFMKRRKHGYEQCCIPFVTVEGLLTTTTTKGRRFQVVLDRLLPPSFNETNDDSNLHYTLQLISKSKSKQVLCSRRVLIQRHSTTCEATTSHFHLRRCHSTLLRITKSTSDRCPSDSYYPGCLLHHRWTSLITRSMSCHSELQFSACQRQTHS
jgi:hypothetical protein